jgi:mRNA interferase YafQ
MQRLRQQGKTLDLLFAVIDKLRQGEKLDRVYRDHSLRGNLSGLRECHVQPDWLLLYYVEADVMVLTLTRTGSHSDLLRK